MNELETRYEVERKDLVKEKSLRYGAAAAPFVAAGVPAAVLFLLGFVFGTTPPAAAVFFFLSFITLIVGFVVGIAASGGLLYYRSKWLANVRERIAVDGIKAEEIDWFRNELTSSEKKSLKEVEKRDLLLGDAYRDSLAARLTATRIKKAAQRELLFARRRQNKLKYLKSANSKELIDETSRDVEKLQQIHSEAEEMNVEAQTRLQMIEAAARRGTDLAHSELALKKLTARSADLPLALESARMKEEIRKELEAELEEKDEISEL
ncbi:MAG: hypothetical protein KIS76_00700 [Pyrinomonadaceae bacterium]|nr:hypothetical protein [Pyrinomonadaceae bacterium]